MSPNIICKIDVHGKQYLAEIIMKRAKTTRKIGVVMAKNAIV
jgi:hypothetical protein